jgi:hypothetical protein
VENGRLSLPAHSRPPKSLGRRENVLTIEKNANTYYFIKFTTSRRIPCLFASISTDILNAAQSSQKQRDPSSQLSGFLKIINGKNAWSP